MSAICMTAALLVLPALSQSLLKPETEEQKAERMSWWTEARFGMFIHWGLYSLPARHEWVKNYEHMTNEEYPEVLRSLQS